MINQASTITTSTTASRIKPISMSRLNDRTRAMIKITGTGSTICIKLVMANCTVVISDTVLVVIDAVPNCRKS